jgi:hypothetical protein
MAEPDVFDSDALPRQYFRQYPYRTTPRGAAGGIAHTYDNLPDRFEQIILEPGEKKVEVKLDTRKPSFQA